MQNFVILANQRSGSTLLAKMLDSHGDITCHGEVIHAPGYQNSWDEHINDKSKTVKKAHGFKLMMNFIEPLGLHWLLDYIAQMDYRIILLLRRDKFLQGIFQRGSFELVGDRVMIRCANLIDRIEMFIEFEKRYSQIADMIFTYEDMTNGENISEFKNDKIRLPLLSMLGVDDRILTSELRKNSRKSNQELIVNYDEVSDLDLKYSNHSHSFINLKKNAIVV